MAAEYNADQRLKSLLRKNKWLHRNQTEVVSLLKVNKHFD